MVSQVRRGRATCRVCSHREIAAIDLGIARGVSVTALAKRYRVSTDSIYRHRSAHMPPQLRAALIAGPSLEGVDLDKLRETESQSLLMHLVSLRNRLFAALDTAEEYKDNAMVTRVTSQIHTNLELMAKLLGDLSTGSTTVNVLLQPTYITMRVELVKALQPFPEARTAVAAVLHRLEATAAQAVTAESEGGLQHDRPGHRS